jgi:hypothetical protein
MGQKSSMPSLRRARFHHVVVGVACYALALTTVAFCVFSHSSGARGGIGDIVGREATLFEDLSSSSEKNDAVNGLREDVREWRGNHYPGTALVTRRLLEWWFERGDERKALGKRFVYDAFESFVCLTRMTNAASTSTSDSEDRKKWHTIQIDTGVFDANKGSEATLREIVNTVGKTGMAGERVRCVVSVQMLTEGWDVKSVSHILGIRAFGSPLLTEQIIGRGLRRTNYDVLNQPLS